MQVPAVNPSVNPVVPVWIVAPDVESDLEGTACPCICSNIGLCQPIPGPTAPAPCPSPTTTTD